VGTARASRRQIALRRGPARRRPGGARSARRGVAGAPARDPRSHARARPRPRA
jgi:hypothetical protein